ncbi:hypothetical protein [Azospirillum doebereinerae]|nr:hypothetical protein [Azospirillum doebereinerae]MCG5239848.1 hypothetical protein [Azospirillum doebereinerae]
MSDKPMEDQPVPGAINKQAPKQPDTGNAPKPEKADDREGQTREPGYDEA